VDKQIKIIRVDPSKITDDDGNHIDLTSANALRRWLIKRYSRCEVAVSDNGKTIRFTVKGFRDSLKKRGEVHQQVYADLDVLLENSVYDDSEKGDAKHPYIERQDIYYAAAQIGDKVFGIRFKVDVRKGDEYGTYKDHKVVEIDDVEEVDIKVPPSPYVGVSPTGTEGGKSITVAKIKAAMGLGNNIRNYAQKSKKNKKISSGSYLQN